MLVTIIVLSVILVLAIGIIILNAMTTSKKIDEAYKKGGNDLFAAILANGWEKKVNDFKEYNKYVKKGGIVFVGDSLTDNYNVYEYYKGLDVYNRGIGGDTTEGLLRRMDESIFDLEPSKIVLLIGINDFELVKNSTPNTIYQNILKIIALIKERLPETEIILESLYPVNKSEDKKIDIASVINKDNEKIKEVNNLIKDIKGVTYVDMYSKLVDEKGMLNIDYTMEGLHVNSFGYHVVTKEIRNILEK